MKKSITPYLIFSITAGFALTLSFGAFAADDNPNDQKKAAAAAAAKAPAVQARDARTVRANANQSVATAPAGTQAAQSRGARGVRSNANGNQTQTATVRTGASGGGRYTRANNYGGRWTAGNNHPGWNQGRVNDWNGHQYRWFDGGWLMVDGGFWPVPGYYRSGGSLMAGAQQQLATDGYYNGPIDGIAGPGTRQAIANYQTDNNLPATGHLNIPTQQSLGLD